MLTGAYAPSTAGDRSDASSTARRFPVEEFPRLVGADETRLARQFAAYRRLGVVLLGEGPRVRVRRWCRRRRPRTPRGRRGRERRRGRRSPGRSGTGRPPGCRASRGRPRRGAEAVLRPFDRTCLRFFPSWVGVRGRGGKRVSRINRRGGSDEPRSVVGVGLHRGLRVGVGGVEHHFAAVLGASVDCVDESLDRHAL
ncbi:hypothetical protein SAMN05216278_3378 [Halopelagius longus]|uniref:Uncharacterized protein n=1 Tax=Halopelagius longus TaxID=1236180 RepID=A0A1H1FT22_9EURY|nr:hypothetical protein SAMN05216278_3378 [Halopelagius longus]